MTDAQDMAIKLLKELVYPYVWRSDEFDKLTETTMYRCKVCHAYSTGDIAHLPSCPIGKTLFFLDILEGYSD